MFRCVYGEKYDKLRRKKPQTKYLFLVLFAGEKVNGL